MRIFEKNGHLSLTQQCSIMDSAFWAGSCVEEEGGLPLRLSSLMLRRVFCWKLGECHRQTVAGDINESVMAERLCARRRRVSLKPVFY
jgi:hypothetical protein